MPDINPRLSISNRQSSIVNRQCKGCGACCHALNPQLVELLGCDQALVPGEYAAHRPDGGAHIRMIPAPSTGGWVCSALSAGNLCRIYAQRPFLCREFKRGSRECIEAIMRLKIGD